jgi:hypothetical protein
LLCPEGTKPNRAVIRLDEEMTLLTRDELEKLYHWLTIDLLADPDTDPEWRREILSTLDVCPCCERWMGHNRPPADDGDPPYRRQASFDFDR